VLGAAGFSSGANQYPEQVSSDFVTPSRVPLSFSERLQAVTEALAAARTQADVFGIVLAPALDALHALAGTVLLVDDTATLLLRVAHHGHAPHSLWQDSPLHAPVPAHDALQRREALFFEHPGALLLAYPDLETRTGGRAAVATAILPMIVGDRPLGALILDFQDPHHFTSAEVRFLRTLAAQCGVALERAQLQHSLEARVAARTAQLEEQRAALDAFVAYKEAVGSESDVLALARQAVRVVQASLEYVSAAYYELDGGLWKARVWSPDVRPEVAAEIQAGVPADAPDFREAAQSRAAVFADGWNAEANELPSTRAYGAVAFLPLVVNGQAHSLFVVGTRDARAWTEREKALIRAVARGLSISLERTEVMRQLQAQNAELDARTRALEGYAQLTQDLALEDDAVTLVGRAQELLVSLIPGSVSTYYEPEGEVWKLLSHRGEFWNPALLQVLGRGLPRGGTLNVDSAFETRQPYYQDQHDPDSVAAARQEIRVIRTSVALPVFEGEEPRGVLAVGLHHVHQWTSIDRAVLDTVLRSLALALERAKQAGALQQRTSEVVRANEELHRSNAELEQFAYIASHDLQAPIRAVASFAGIISKRYGERLDERGRLYLQQIVDSGEHMKRLVDDLLAFSRVHTEQRPFLPVEGSMVFDAVARRLKAEAPAANMTRDNLPVVQADGQQLDQLLQNLIANGLKYHRAGVASQVHVSAEREGDFWRFAVSDNGIGIEPQYFARIFEIFQRLHGRESYEGTGIGLAVCKKIVERHGGRLWVESVVGVGSTFLFTLPWRSGRNGSV